MNHEQQELNVSEAFSRQSPSFDHIDEANRLLLWMRNRVHTEVLKHIKKDDYLLELNCGTGIDALFFAGKGIKVLATDNAPGMLQRLKHKLAKSPLNSLVTAQQCSFEQISQLGTDPVFDYVFSNFGGLNCTKDLDKVLLQMDALLKPGGHCSLVIMPKVCIWEILLVFKGYFKTAFRRLKKNGTIAHVEGVYFDCFYYNPSYIINCLGPRYKLLNLKGLSVTVPPPYIEHFVEKRPKLFSFLERIENRICNTAPFNRMGDHFMITMQKQE